MSQMFASAEVRWFWCGRCPQEIRDWFFKIGLPPGGGQYRIDRYIVQRSQPTLSIKQRGDELTLEVKGQVTTRRTPELDPLASYLEVWCKWSCAIPGLNFKDQLAVSKTRWRRKFDTSKHVRSEIPLATNERPQRGYSLPIQGCDVELTEVKIVSKSGTWARFRSIRQHRHGFSKFDIGTAAGQTLLGSYYWIRRTYELPHLAYERDQPSKLGTSE